MPDLPAGTVTFLFSDIEGSTALLRLLGDASFAAVREEHHRIVRSALEAHGGVEVDTQGDGFFLAFRTARSALACAIAIQRAVAAQPWPEGCAVRVRIGLHTGEALATSTGYIGMDVHLAARISAAGYGGQILLSLTTSSLVRKDLPANVLLRDLGQHRLKGLEQSEQITQVVLPDLPSEFPPLRSLSPALHNLPVQLTPFIGREREMAEIRRRLDETRLLTLTGPGGSGKTRLALQVAAHLIDAFPGGVWLTTLARGKELGKPTGEEALARVAQAVASSLGLREEERRPPEAVVVEYLREAKMLLILDNCAHLQEGCARLAETVLRAARGMKILATSEQPLGAAGEAVYSVLSLGVPDRQQFRAVEALRESDAVRLFVDRAMAASAQFVPDDTAMPAVAQIVRQLQGIPLAIELAAAKVKMLSVHQLAAQLDDRFRLLTRGANTLQATLDWSHDLLTGPQAVLFRRLAPFAGWFRLEDAEAVCADDAIRRDDVVDLLSALVDKSLVVVDQSGKDALYRLLDLVRRYAAEKLDATTTAVAVRAHHRAHFTERLHETGKRIYGPDDTPLAQFERDHEDLRTALEWSLQQKDLAEAFRLAVAMAPFWELGGYWSEGRRYLETVLAAAAELPAALRADGLCYAGGLAIHQGDYARAEALGLEALRLSEHSGELREMAVALQTLGAVHYYHNEYGDAQRRYEEALRQAHLAGDLRVTASVKLGLAANLIHLDRYEEAERLATEALEDFKRSDHQRGVASAMNLLGIMKTDQGDFDEAVPLFEDSLKIRRSVGDRRGIASSLSSLGLIARHTGDFDAAEAHYRESLVICRGLGALHGVAIALAGLGITATLRGDMVTAAGLLKEGLDVRAARRDVSGVAECLQALARVIPDPAASVRLLGAAAALRADPGRADLHHTPTATDPVPVLRRALGDSQFEAAWRDGQAMTMDAAVAYARSITI
ncbi:MAG TPA: tetratricopeptide repeat protein [bacterium]|nr:tetratricopeptide repeat protein [bacterium]